MKQIIAPLLALFLPFLFTLHVTALTQSDITAESAVLIDADTGQVLYAKGMHESRYPASVTKIMTALLTLENCAIDEQATVSTEAAAIPYNTSHIALIPGEVMSVDNLLYGLMLPSANDAANVLAEHVAGTQEDFARLMTQRAAELGARDTTFRNAHGLPDDAHVTTAYDIARITAAALEQPDFLRYYGAAKHTIPPTNRQPEERNIYNQQFMLVPGQWVYNPEVIGGKVGYTDEARHTMSSAAVRGGRTLVAVVLGCGYNERFYDTQKLFDFGFEEFYPVEIPPAALQSDSVPVTENGADAGEAVFFHAGPLTLLLPNTVGAQDIEYQFDLPASVERDGDMQASVTLTLREQPANGASMFLVELPLSAQIEHAQPALRSGQPKLRDSNAVWRVLWAMRWPLLIAAAIVALLLVRRYQIARRRARRIERRQRLLRERMR